MLVLVPLPIGTIVVLMVLYGVVKHFWLFLFTVGPVALAGMAFVRWCWDCQDRRRAARQARRETRFSQQETK